MRRFLFATLSLGFLLHAQSLAGNYAVGAGGTYPTLGAALAALSANGASGPVTFALSGTETGPFTINGWPGQGIAAPVTITGGTITSTVYPAINVTGGSHLTFNGTTIAATTSVNLVAIGGTASNITFTGCTATVPATTATASPIPSAFQITGGSFITISQSTFGGGYEAFAHTGGTDVLVERCKVAGGGYWIGRMEAANCTFRNNFVTAAAYYGLRVGAAATNGRIVGNSFYVNHPTSSSQYCAVRWYGATTLNTEVVDNIFHEIFGTPGTGVNMWCSGTLRPTIMNGNCFNPVNGLGVVFGGSNLTLAAWQATGYDTNSIQGDPLYVNQATGDLHLTAISPCLSAGQNSPWLVDDHDGQPRVAPFDIGADEATINNLLTATTTGAGTGDLYLSLGLIDPLATEGWCLVSTDATHALGTGPFFGLWPDAFTWSTLISQPMLPGNPLHFPTGIGGVFPDTAIVLPPGALSSLAGSTWDIVGVLVGPGLTFVGRSNTARLAW